MFIFVWIFILLALAIIVYINEMKAIHYCHEDKKWIFWFPILWAFLPSIYKPGGEKFRKRGFYLLCIAFLWMSLFFITGHLLDY